MLNGISKLVGSLDGEQYRAGDAQAAGRNGGKCHFSIAGSHPATINKDAGYSWGIHKSRARTDPRR